MITARKLCLQLCVQPWQRSLYAVLPEITGGCVCYDKVAFVLLTVGCFCFGVFLLFQPVPDRAGLGINLIKILICTLASKLYNYMTNGRV